MNKDHASNKAMHIKLTKLIYETDKLKESKFICQVETDLLYSWLNGRVLY